MVKTTQTITLQQIVEGRDRNNAISHFEAEVKKATREFATKTNKNIRELTQISFDVHPECITIGREVVKGYNTTINDLKRDVLHPIEGNTVLFNYLGPLFVIGTGIGFGLLGYYMPLPTSGMPRREVTVLAGGVAGILTSGCITSLIDNSPIPYVIDNIPKHSRKLTKKYGRYMVEADDPLSQRFRDVEAQTQNLQKIVGEFYEIPIENGRRGRRIVKEVKGIQKRLDSNLAICSAYRDDKTKFLKNYQRLQQELQRQLAQYKR